MEMAWFGVLKVAHRKAREKAFELFEQGWFAPETSSAINVSLRTVQRWRKQFDEEKNDGNRVTSSAQTSDEIVAANHLVKNQQPRTLDNTDWFTFAQNLSRDHFACHNQIRTKLERIINEKLDETDINVRIIHSLSLAVMRHVAGEREAQSLEYLDLSRSALRLEAAGFIVSDPSSAIIDEIEEE